MRQSRCQLPGEARPSTVLLRSKPHSEQRSAPSVPRTVQWSWRVSGSLDEESLAGAARHGALIQPDWRCRRLLSVLEQHSHRMKTQPSQKSRKSRSEFARSGRVLTQRSVRLDSSIESNVECDSPQICIVTIEIFAARRGMPLCFACCLCPVWRYESVDRNRGQRVGAKSQGQPYEYMYA